MSSLLLFLTLIQEGLRKDAWGLSFAWCVCVCDFFEAGSYYVSPGWLLTQGNSTTSASHTLGVQLPSLWLLSCSCKFEILSVQCLWNLTTGNGNIVDISFFPPHTWCFSTKDYWIQGNIIYLCFLGHFCRNPCQRGIFKLEGRDYLYQNWYLLELLDFPIKTEKGIFPFIWTEISEALGIKYNLSTSSPNLSLTHRMKALPSLA